MKSLNCSPENCRRKGVIGLGLLPDHKPVIITINVSHGLDKYEVAVPSNSTFGDGKEDDENLQTAGVNDSSELLLMEDATREEKIPEEIHETFVISKGEEDVAQVRQEVDKLEQQVYALQGVVDNGTGMTVDDKEIIYLTEILMRQLLNLDGIEAEGEGKIQRKMEVRRVQSIVERLDNLKSRIAMGTKRSINTQWETPRL